MTCIVAFVDKKTVYMGADSCGSNGHSYAVYPRHKIFKVNDRFLFGCTSSYRMIDLLEHSFEPPELTESYDPDRYMRKDFITALRKCFKDGGFNSDSDDEDNAGDRGGNFLVGFDGHLFEVQPDFSVLSCPKWGHSVGSGEEAANAVLFHLYQDASYEPETVLRSALEAAEGTITTVKGPFTFDQIGPLGWRKPLREESP